MEFAVYYVISKNASENCGYGEIAVFASQPGIYFCSANWNPGHGAGGYCGIQQIEDGSRKAICSVWDTTALLRPRVIHVAASVQGSRFGGEGEGARTIGPSDWQVGEVFRYFIQKRPGSPPDTTEVRFFTGDNPQSR